MASGPLVRLLFGLVGLLAMVAFIHVMVQSTSMSDGGLRDLRNVESSSFDLGGGLGSFYSEFNHPKASWFHDKEKSYVIAPALGNETARALLGQSTWRLIHTTMARFPLKPTENEKMALKQFIFLLSRLYPCGDCAQHFQQLLQEFPPHVDSRYDAEQWACAAHNRVNKRLGKELLDCSTVRSLYDCGCKS